MQTQTTTTSSNYLSSSSSGKWGDLIVKPFHKRMKASIQKYIAYFDFYPLDFPALHWIISLLRLLQFVGPSIMAGDESIWGRDTASSNVMSIISCIYNYMPANMNVCPIGSPILYAFSAIIIVYLLCFLFAAVQYSKSGKTSVPLAYTLNIFCNTAAFIMQPFLERIICYCITAMARGAYRVDIALIIACIIAQVMLLVSFWFISSLFLRTLNFHPCSLLSLEEYAQMMVMIYSIAISGVGAILSQLDQIVQIIGLAICAILYGASTYVLYTRGTFIDIKQQTVFGAFAIWGCLNCIMFVVYVAMKKTAQEEAITLIVVFFIISYIISHFAIQKKIQKQLKLFDLFDEEHDVTIFKSPAKLVNATITGFQYGHPVCLDFSIFRSACAVWQDNGELWFVFAKFNVIYPENTQVLNMISQSIQTAHIKSGLAKFAVQQISTVQKSREVNLTSELKSKIEKIQKLMNNSKRKMRNMWDLILQGNTKDLETNAKNVYVSVEKLTKELDQLLMQFPNNRFVARLYARYANEILADPALFRKWHENVGLLQRGVNVIPDNYHEMGMAVFDNLPNKIVNEFVTTKTMLETDLSIDDFTESDTNNQNRTMIPDLVKKHHVAALTKTKYIFIGVLIICMIIPTIIVLSTYQSTHDSIAAPLEYLYGVAYLRQLNYMLASISGRFFMTKYIQEDGEYFSDNPIIPDTDYSSFGYHTEYNEMLRYFIREVSTMADYLDTFRGDTSNDDEIEYAKSILFEDTCPFYYFYNLNNYDTTYISAETIVTSVANYLSKVIEDNITIDKDIIVTTDVMIGWNNYWDTGLSISDALTHVINFMNSNTDKNNKMYLYIEIALIAAQVIITLCAFIYCMYCLKKDKASLFKVFTYLPKTVISNVSASFYNIKGAKDKFTSTTTQSETGNEGSKPEEAMLKVFTSIADSSFDISSNFLLFICVAIFIVFGALGAHFACQMVQVLTSTLRDSAPHIDYLLGTSSFMHGSFASLFKACMALNDLDGVTLNAELNLEESMSLIDQMRTYYHTARYGSTTDSPYVGLQEGIDSKSGEIPCRFDTYVTNDYYNITSCFDLDQNIYIFIASLRKLITVANMTSELAPRGDMTDLWNQGPMLLYDILFNPLASDIVATITEYTNSEFTRLLALSLVFVVLCIIACISIIFQTFQMEKPLKFALSQLQHCPEDVCLKIPKMMSLLAGDYSVTSDDSSEKDDRFFESVVNKLTGLILVANIGDNTIVSTNKSFNNYFGFQEGELVGKHLYNDFFRKECFEGNFDKLRADRSIKVIYKKDDTKMNILFTMTQLESEYIIEGSDISLQVRHETLISDEKKRSDAMLASILPASLVPRVQAGESNISFAVKSVSVSFIDIVSFTPWCGSNTAQYVMKMLNKIFKEFDSVVSTLPTLTRIKCIGDCYMCAGGIFDEVNNPSQHAKEMVEFGCQAIKKIEEIDQEDNEKLRIRVGVNTGGPIVAGILGSDKPTFEILGPPINIAQQMEHNGVPMQVHLSRAVYELIYGDKFVIKERGEIDVKNGKMFTYLVSP